jgi:hypothetical protein
MWPTDIIESSSQLVTQTNVHVTCDQCLESQVQGTVMGFELVGKVLKSIPEKP